MDRIRKALDLARLERAEAQRTRTATGAPAEAPEAAPANVAEFIESPAANTSRPQPAIGRTRVFNPPRELLERNRILNPSGGDSAAVAFRMLRTQVLQRMDAHGWRTLAIFSPGSSEGKSTTAANLAASLASDRLHTVLLVEFDFRHPTLAARFGLAAELGSDDILKGDAHVADCLYHPEGFDRFVLMPARESLVHSSELLAGPRSRDLVSELRTRYPDRIVVFDLPPVLTADDALAFAPLVECGLVIAAEGRTRRKDLVRTVELLHKTPLVGTVLNRAADAPPGY